MEELNDYMARARELDSTEWDTIVCVCVCVLVREEVQKEAVEGGA